MAEWRKLEWLPSYEISDDGRVRRTVTKRGCTAGDIIRGSLHRQGYWTYFLRENGSGKWHFAHRLVCEAFHGSPPDDRPWVAHFDGDKLNNHVSNLRWASRKENERDKRRHGTLPMGERHHNATLDWERVRAIRSSFGGRRGEIKEMAAKYGVSRTAVSLVLRSRTWPEKSA